MPILEAKNITKKFGDFTAVHNISFELEQGEILGFLGPNGAGKTTTIQMLLGILTPTSGKVLYFGKNLWQHRTEIMEQVNFSSTYTNLPWWLTVKENLTYISYLYKIKNRKQRVEKVVEIFQLEEILKKTMTDLSAGQLTRVNLAKAFLNFPKILLLDEPTASLDVEIAQYIRDFLLEEQKSFAVSIIITSHNMAEVEELCDRVIVINNGTIIANDTPDELAKSIKTSHVELLVKNGIKELMAHCEREHMRYHLEGRFITIDVNTSHLPQFLHYLHEKDIRYNEISIQKPSLEDYFLQVIGDTKHEIT